MAYGKGKKKGKGKNGGKKRSSSPTETKYSIKQQPGGRFAVVSNKGKKVEGIKTEKAAKMKKRKMARNTSTRM